MITNIKAKLIWGGTRILTVDGGKGVIDDAARDAFTHGQCHSLAIALHDLTDWPIIGIGGDPDSPNHFVVYSPKIDDFIDIGGPGAFSRDYGEHLSMLKEFTRDEAIHPEYYLKANLKAAKPFAKTIYEQISALPTTTKRDNAKRYLLKYAI
jgi:hypothetical protein